MQFIDEDIHSLKQNASQFNQNYESDFNAPSRRLLLMHALHYLIFIKEKLTLNEEEG
jgi:hypothetical protein